MTSAALIAGVPDPAMVLTIVPRYEAVDSSPNVSSWSRVMMRGVDLLGATVLLVVFSPVFIVASLLVKLSSPGPVIFRHERLGQHGASFVVLKFRTMADGTHERVLSDPELRRQYQENEFKLPAGHAHITSIGKWLRKTSLDELPQLVNVLRGEMGLVGVRPIERDQFLLRGTYDQELYCLHRPALTGLWQVQGRSAIGGDHRVELDRECLEQWGVWCNVKLLLRTPAVVLSGDGAH